MDMKEKLAQEREKRLNKAGPGATTLDMNPGTRKKKEAEPLPPTIEEIIAQRKATVAEQVRLEALIEAHVGIGKQERALAAEKAKFTTVIKEILNKNPNLHQMQCAASVVQFFAVSRASIKAEKLLERGVSPEDIAAATTTSKSMTLKIRALDDLDDGD